MNVENKMCLEWWMGKFTRPYFSTLRDYHSHVESENFIILISKTLSMPILVFLDLKILDKLRYHILCVCAMYGVPLISRNLPVKYITILMYRTAILFLPSSELGPYTISWGTEIVFLAILLVNWWLTQCSGRLKNDFKNLKL